MTSYPQLGVGLAVSAVLLFGLIRVGGATTGRRKRITVNGQEYEAQKNDDTITVTMVGSKPITSIQFNSTEVLEARGNMTLFPQLMVDLPAIALQTRSL